LIGTIKLNGSEVEVQVRHDDGRPAAGVPLRLLYARQLTTAAANTDAQGRWVHSLQRSGPYEVVVETGTETEDTIRLPFTLLDGVEADSIPWGVVAFLGSGVFILVLVAVIGMSRFVSRGEIRFKWRSLLALLVIGIGATSWAGYYFGQSKSSAVPAGPNIANSAREFLISREVKPLSGPLELLLADDSKELVKTDTHPLLGKPAPDFELTDHQKKTWRLRDQFDKGPVVLVFYYGYHCNHCVGQLFALHDDVAKFRELGATVVAVSADSHEWTQQRFKQYGEFAFPVLADPGNKIAQAYGMFRPAAGKLPDDLQHGTFVIDRAGVIQWTQYGYEPFTGNRTLLHELARLESRLPTRKKS
jgi:peroxiredoxin